MLAVHGTPLEVAAPAKVPVTVRLIITPFDAVAVLL